MLALSLATDLCCFCLQMWSLLEADCTEPGEKMLCCLLMQGFSQDADTLVACSVTGWYWHAMTAHHHQPECWL